MRNRLGLAAQVAIVAAAIVLGVARFAALDAASHSASDTLRPWAVEAAVIAAVAVIAVVVAGRLRATEP